MSMGDGYGGGPAGFVAGLFSGMTKLAVGQPFDIIKVRMQTNPEYKGIIDALVRTVRYDGLRGLYKGSSALAVGWTFIDATTMGAITNYRACLKSFVWPDLPTGELPFAGKILSAIAAGWTVSFVAAPVEHVKIRLQVQYNNKANTKVYTGPIDCVQKLIAERGVCRGLYHGLGATMLFRTNFAFWWGAYDLTSIYLAEHTSLSTPTISFWSGGIGATMFWVMAYPSDIVKQQIMTDSLTNPKYKTYMDAVRAVYNRGGLRAFTRGFSVAIVRSFPTNASALAAFELAMMLLHKDAEPGPRIYLDED